MSQKNPILLIDKTTRNRIFNSRYWKEECFALNAESIIDKAIQLKCIGGLYSGTKKPTKFFCLLFKMLQMNLPKEIVLQYLKAREYKYLNALALVYLRITLKAPQVYVLLEPFYIDNRKLLLRQSSGKYGLTYVDQLIEDLLEGQTWMGIAIPFIPKRLALENQEVLEPRVSPIEEDLPTEVKEQMEQS